MNGKGGPRGRGKRIGSKGPIFAVHNKNRKMDKIGIGYSEDYTNITWKDIQTYIKYDVFDNNFFVIGNPLLCQKKGIAIISASFRRNWRNFLVWEKSSKF